MDFFQSIESVFIGNGVITAFLFVGCIIWISYFISNKFTNGKFHGSAIAIIIGLSLAYLGGKVTGGTKGLADITIFSGLKPFSRIVSKINSLPKATPSSEARKM